MPLNDPISGLFKDEYTRAMRGLDGLAGVPTERPVLGADGQELTGLHRERALRARARRAMQRDQENAARPRVIEIPGWGDVFHVAPRLSITKEQAQEYYRATRRGFTPALPPEVVDELRRREARRDAMARSPQPAFDRAWGSVMTAMDNIQDFLSSVSVLGRVVVKVAPRLGVRLIPGLGPLVLAADVLVAMMTLGQYAFPAWVALCAGWKAGLRAALGTALTNATFCAGLTHLSRTSAKSIGWTLRRPSPTRAVNGLIGSLLVLGQTTDQLFGYGISLGPIVGYTMSTGYAAEAILRGEPVEVRASPSAEHFAPHIAQRLRELPTSALYDRINAADVWAHAGLVLAADSPATDEERVLCMAAVLAAIGVLWEDWHGSGWQEELPRLAGWMPAPVSAAIEAPGWREIPPIGGRELAPEWPISWGSRTYDLDLALNVVPGAIVAGLDRAAERLPDQAAAVFLGAATTEAGETLWRFLEDDPDAFEAKLQPGWLTAWRMTMLGLLPVPPEQLEDFQPFWTAAVARVEGSRRGMMTRAEWEQLADAHHVALAILAPPEIVAAGGPA